MTGATENFIDLGDLAFHYLEWGGSGQPLVLLHGLASNAHYWDLAAPYLARHFQTVALDQRGHGASAKPDHGYDFPTVAGDVEDFIRTLGLKRPIIVGHSWGGNVAVQVASDYPTLLAGLVCIDGGLIEPAATPGATWEETEQRLAPPDFVAMNVTWDSFLERARDRGMATYWGDKMVDFLQANFDVLDDGKVRPKLTRERHMQIVRALWDQRVSQLLPRVVCPVLLMPARREQHQDSSGRSFAEERNVRVTGATELLNRHRLVWMEDSIHDVPVQRPQEVANVIIQAADDGFFDD